MKSTLRRSFWRFSLREMLLLTALVAALLAVVVTNKPYSRSAFLNLLDEQTVLTQVFSDLNVQLELGGSGFTGYGSWSDGGRETSLMVNTPDVLKFQTEVMPEFRKSIEKVLLDSGSTIEGKSQGGKRLQEFSFRYRNKGTQGRIRVYSLEQAEATHRLLILVDEW